MTFQMFWFWIFKWTGNTYLLVVGPLWAALFYGRLKDRGLVCSLEAEVGKGLPVSLIGHHLLVHQVHLDIVESFNSYNSSNYTKSKY